jgi:hypothetical protein
MPRKRTVFCLVDLCMILALFFAVGCAHKNFQQPIANFQQNIEKSAVIISQYYNELNAYERNLYLQERLYNPDLSIYLKNKNNRPTPLAGTVFSVEGVQARLDSLDLLAAYALRLSALAGSEAPAKAEEASQALGQNLNQLSQTFKKLNKKGDPTAKDYLTPVSSLVGLVGRMYLEAKQEKALTKFVKQGEPSVSGILNNLEKDMGSIVKQARQTGESMMLAERVNYYNLNKSQMTFEERRLLISEINLAAQGRQLALAVDPAKVVQDIRNAHNALVAYAESDKQPKDLSQLAAAMELFANRVDQAAQALKQFP